MIRWAQVVLAVGLAGCSQPGGLTATLSGVRMMVAMDERPSESGLADVNGDAGISNRYLFVASADTDDLRVLDMWRPGFLGRAFIGGPNPLEVLSIPVVDRPELLAADQGLNASGNLVTGAYLYVASSGGKALSVVDASRAGLVPMTPEPLPVGESITAMVAWMGQGLTVLPNTGTLYVATTDSDTGAIVAMRFPELGADRAKLIQQVVPQPVAQFPKETIMSMVMVPPWSGRVLDGAPFCARSACLAVATRGQAGKTGRTILIELESLRTATLNFPSAVNRLAPPPDGIRLYGILNRETCDDATCGGVIGVDTSVGTSAAGFPVLKDFTGQAMTALGGTDFPIDLALTLQAPLLQIALSDAGIDLLLQQHETLGFYSSGNGKLVPFDATVAARIDYDGRRPDIGFAQLNVVSNEGSYDVVSTSITRTPLGPAGASDVSSTLYEFDIFADGGSYDLPNPLVLKIADGYFVNQSVTISYEGTVPTFELLPVDATLLPTVTFPVGRESRLRVGDYVVFGAPDGDGGILECGESTVVALDAGSLASKELPNACGTVPTIYSVRAGPTAPVVIGGSVEGFIGRGDVGDVVTYTRPYAAYPSGFDGVRPAMVATIGSIPRSRGSYWGIAFNGNVVPFQIELDPTACSTQATTFVPTNVFLGPTPNYISSISTVYGTSLFATYPAPNGVVEIPTSRTYDLTTRLLTAVDSVVCYR